METRRRALAAHAGPCCRSRAGRSSLRRQLVEGRVDAPGDAPATILEVPGIAPNFGPNDGDGFTLQNTIIAENHDLGGAPAPDCLAEAGSGTPITSLGYNLIQDTTRCTILGDPTGDLTCVDPVLGPLTDNGGATRTHALLDNSPAIDPDVRLLSRVMAVLHVLRLTNVDFSGLWGFL